MRDVQAHSRRRRMRRGRSAGGLASRAAGSVACAAVCVGALAGSFGALPIAAAAVPGTATTTIPGTVLEGGSTDAGATTFFAYAAAGEQVLAQLAVGSWTSEGARVVVRDPAGSVVHEATVAESTPLDADVGGAWSSSVAGVWSVEVHDPPSGGRAGLEWDLAVARDGLSVPGRVWTESAALFTPATTTIAVYAAAPDGAVYRVTLDGYDGVDSTLRMNDVGNAAVGTCEPAHRSVPMPQSPEAGGAGARFWQPSASDCDGLSAYRLFLDHPAADLPASTTAWADGRTTDTWLSAQYASPTISGLAFARDAQGGDAGVLSGVLEGQPGVVQVQVDVDGDGSYAGAVDVVADVPVLEPGAFAWTWDGQDAAGEPVPPTTTGVTFRAWTAQVSPLHFLRIDAETSEVGIQVEALSGPRPGVAALRWDDSGLAASSERRWTTTPQLASGETPVDSTGGVHGWLAGGAQPNQNDGVTGSWGDLRSIDDWASIEDHAEATVALAPLADLRIDKRVVGEPTVGADGRTAIVRWSLEVGNLGPVPATEVLVRDAYPEQVDPASVAIATEPTQGAIDLVAGAWHVGTLAPGATATVAFQATVTTQPGVETVVRNQAVATSPDAPHVPGDCQPNDDLAGDTDRCDVVETPIAPPVPPVPVEPAVPVSSAPPAPANPGDATPTPTRDGGSTPAAPGRLPETGADLLATAAPVAAVLVASGIALLLVRRRGRDRQPREE